MLQQDTQSPACFACIEGVLAGSISPAPALSMEAEGGGAGTAVMVVLCSWPPWMVATVICWPALTRMPSHGALCTDIWCTVAHPGLCTTLACTFDPWPSSTDFHALHPTPLNLSKPFTARSQHRPTWIIPLGLSLGLRFETEHPAAAGIITACSSQLRTAAHEPPDPYLFCKASCSV